MLGYVDCRPASKTQVCVLTRGPVVELGVEVPVKEKADGTQTISSLGPDSVAQRRCRKPTVPL